jgi:hypothetical protein
MEDTTTKGLGAALIGLLAGLVVSLLIPGWLAFIIIVGLVLLLLKTRSA